MHLLSASSGKPHSAFLRRSSRSEGPPVTMIISLNSPCLANLSSKRLSKPLKRPHSSIDHLSGGGVDPQSSRTNSQKAGDMMVESITRSGSLRSRNTSSNVVRRVNRRRTAISVSCNSLCSVEGSEIQSAIDDGRNGSQRLPNE